MGKIVTFYSYKGGVGRTMAVANVGALLAQAGRRVALIDWDLESPGLATYLADPADLPKLPGLLDLVERDLIASRDGPSNVSRQVDINPYLHPVRAGLAEKLPRDKLRWMPAGLSTADYAERVQRFNWEVYFSQHRGGYFLEHLRRWLDRHCDVTLIDSRTGLSDTSGICTIQLPDVVVLLFTTHDQGVQGTLDVARAISNAAPEMRAARPAPRILLVPARVPLGSELDAVTSWLEQAEKRFRDVNVIMEADHPSGLATYLLPYEPAFQFGEQLPALRSGLERLARLPGAYRSLHTRIWALVEPQQHVAPAADPLTEPAVQRRVAASRASRSESAALSVRGSQQNPVLRLLAEAEAEPDSDKAERILREALGAAQREPQELDILVRILLARTIAERNPLEAEELLLQAAARSRELQERYLAAIAGLELGDMARRRYDLSKAERHYADALADLEAEQNEGGIAEVQLRLADLALYRG